MNKIPAGFLNDQDLINACSCFNHNHRQHFNHQLPPSPSDPPLQSIIIPAPASASASASSLENGADVHHQIQMIMKGKKQIKKCNHATVKKKKMKELDSSKDYIHVRARRGQATDSHSLAERLRRAKISGRMKQLQALVPGCDKVTGKAVMLEEIINYIQSLQYQVEFLSMKLASINPMFYNMGNDLAPFMVEPEMQGMGGLMANAQQCNNNPTTIDDSTKSAFTIPNMDNVLTWDVVLDEPRQRFIH